LISRRSFLRASLVGAIAGPFTPTRDARAQTGFAPVLPGRALEFPRDEGSHPDFRVEWWYITGWLNPVSHQSLGFQVTFFRARPARHTGNPSAFTPRQILIAHAALSDPAQGALVHEQRVARAAFDLAGAREDRLEVWLDDWTLRAETGGYRARIGGPSLSLDLAFAPTQPPLLQGDRGYSRKGPHAESASYYYSLPHLAVRGDIAYGRRKEAVSGRAWFDHEWSSSYMDERAVGWDWIGLNLDGGGALMAFRMRDTTGASLWAGGTMRTPGQAAQVFAPESVVFNPTRWWRSPRTGTNYPVAWSVTVGDMQIGIEPLMHDQENDTRLTTGTVYWEGAVRATRDGHAMGLGYLELTGYWQRLRL